MLNSNFEQYVIHTTIELKKSKSHLKEFFKA